MRALAVVGGLGHPAEEMTPVLDDLFDTVEVHTDVEEGLSRLSDDDHDLLVVGAHAQTMSAARYDEEVRRRHGIHLSPDGRAAIDGWIVAGRPVLALHTAVVSFDDWYRWGEVVGLRWDWGRSHHPPPGPLRVEADAGDFEVCDERYSDLAEIRPVEIVARCEGHPVAWRHRVGAAPVAVDVLGHDAASFAVEGHRRLLVDLVEWLEGNR